MRYHLKYEKISGGWRVAHVNRVVLGELLVKEDGFYDFWPNLSGGCWPEWLLTELSETLKKLNSAWEFEIEHTL